MDALDFAATSRGDDLRRRYDSVYLWARLSPGQNVVDHRRHRLRHERIRGLGRDRNYGPKTAREYFELVHHLRRRVHRKLVPHSQFRSNGCGLRYFAALRAFGNPASSRLAFRLWVAQSLGEHRTAV